MKTDTSLKRYRWLAGVVIAVTPAISHAVEISGFTEPNRSVEVASPEQGIVTDVFVRVGETVAQGQPIASLDDELHKIMLETARERMIARGAIEAAEAELRMRTTRMEKLQELAIQGFGRKEEVKRAEADDEIAQAELKAAREDLIQQQWQFKKIEAELRRRVIRAPMDGVVAARLKEPGEFVAPNEPNVITLVELDPLLAKFPMKRSLARHLRLNQGVSVRFDNGAAVTGFVEEISPIVDAQSGTIKVKVRIENLDRSLLSGERCSIDVPIGEEIMPADAPLPANRSVTTHRSVPNRKVAFQR